MVAGFWHANVLGKDLDTIITLHPGVMDHRPGGDLGTWFRNGPLNRLARWFSTRDGWYAIWAREAFEIEGSEHLHVLTHCPSPTERKNLAAVLRKWFPGSPGVVDVRPVTWRQHPRTGEMKCEGLAYLLKHSSARAIGPKRPGRASRQTFDPKTGAVVAAVLGKRSGVSRSLDAKAIETWKAEQATVERGRARIKSERAEVTWRQRAQQHRADPEAEVIAREDC